MLVLCILWSYVHVSFSKKTIKYFFSTSCHYHVLFMKFSSFAHFFCAILIYLWQHIHDWRVARNHSAQYADWILNKIAKSLNKSSAGWKSKLHVLQINFAWNPRLKGIESSLADSAWIGKIWLNRPGLLVDGLYAL